jgi:hypothetical protein
VAQRGEGVGETTGAGKRGEARGDGTGGGQEAGAGRQRGEAGQTASGVGKGYGFVRRPTKRSTEGREVSFLWLSECGSRPRSTQALGAHRKFVS